MGRHDVAPEMWPEYRRPAYYRRANDDIFYGNPSKGFPLCKYGHRLSRIKYAVLHRLQGEGEYPGRRDGGLFCRIYAVKTAEFFFSNF
ncbi:MAG: hypothetical protein AAYR33_03290 [Acetobacteraceae bacterium]